AGRGCRVGVPRRPLARAGGAPQPWLPLGLRGEPSRALLLRPEATPRFAPGLARLLPGHVPGAGPPLEPPAPGGGRVDLPHGPRRYRARTRRRPARGLGVGGGGLLRYGALEVLALLAARYP